MVGEGVGGRCVNMGGLGNTGNLIRFRDSSE